MNQENKNKLQLCLLISASIFISIIPILVMPAGTLTKLAHSNPNAVSYLFGSIIGRASLLVIIPLLIDMGINFFKKNKSRNWWLIWLIFIIQCVAIFAKHFSNLNP